MSIDYNDDTVLQRELFLLSVADGVPDDNAGYEVGWTPARLRRELADPDFREMVTAAKDRAIGTVEKALFDLATKGKNLGAMQMVLYNLRADKWKDVRRIEVKNEHTVNGQIVVSTREAIMGHLKELGPAGLQPTYGELPPALDEDDIIDAEVIDE